MKICFFNSGYLPDRGGVATLSGDLAEHMARSPEVALVRVVAFKNSNPRIERRDKLEIYAYGARRTWEMAVKIMWHVWRARDFDVFHATNIFPVGFFVLIFAKFVLNKKVFLTIHGTDTITTRGSRATRFLKRYTLRKCDGIIANSRSTAKLASGANQLPISLFYPIYVGVDEQLFAMSADDVRRRHGLGERDFVVLTASQLIRRKGVDNLIRAVAAIQDGDVRLLVLGKGPEEANLRRLAGDLQVADRVTFAGTVDHSRMGSYYRSSDIFALTSRFIEEEGDVEGFGIVLLEAQYFGKPVIGTNSGGIPETFRDKETGFLVAEGDTAAMTDRIMYLKDNPEAYARMSRAAGEFMREEFSWTTAIERHLEVYRMGHRMD
ncbi:MAG: hypothetical protein UY65_C0001G0044 [Parcubacteria group bacterium GW2011_GWA2_51_12]|nr:MAG: hypothetical protein UY65_C0001G0044 [Parcubacteria group bacterium GW2011_GWA2_51_12]